VPTLFISAPNGSKVICVVFAAVFLGVLACRPQTEYRKTAADADLVFQEIQHLRHTDRDLAREKAKKASGEARANAYPLASGQRLRLLYADILIEQNLFAGVDSLLALDPQDAESRTRLLAAIAYWEEKAQNHDELAARILANALAEPGVVDDPCWKAEVLVHYAQLLVSTGKTGAENPLAAARRETSNCPDKFWTAYRYLVEGNLYEKNHRYEQELTSSQTASSLAASYNFGQLVSVTNGNVALAYFHLGDYDKALTLLSRAENWYPKETFDLAIDIGHRARVHHWQDEDSDAVSDYKRAIEMLQRLKLQRDPWCLRYLDELTTVLIDKGQLEAAAAYNRAAIQGSDPKTEQWIISTARLNAASILRNRRNYQPAFAQLKELDLSLATVQDQDAEIIWRLHSELAQTLAAMGRKDEADEEFKTAVDTADKVRTGIDDDWNRMTFSVYVEKLVSQYIDFEVGEGNAARALQLAETFRAQRLTEKLHLAKAVAPEQFQNIARSRRSIILSYWITKKYSYVWVTTAQEIKVFPLMHLETLSTEIANHNSEIYQGLRPLLDSPKSSTDLYRKLVAPVAALIPLGANVIIVPDGPLAALNFETLIPPASPAKFWLNSVSASVAPSLAVIEDGGVSKERPQRFLLVGGTIAKNLPPLSDREIPAIEALFPSVAKVTLSGKEASPRIFLQSRPGEFSLLHISAHAFANKESPLDSAIFLTPDEAHPDGKLYAHDLEDLSLSAQLVTLSACESAGGRNLPGEGLIGLTWAILSAGARNVVAGLWKVSDNATADFMKQFYAYLRAGEQPAQALHDAKVAMADKQPIPYYWAAFQLYTR
jgi:CHAT domain-containing protein